MGKDFARFTAEVGKGISIKDTHVEVKLFIPLKAAIPHLEFLSNSQAEKVNVALGNPQVAFDFDEEDDDPMYQKHTGRFVTADSSGVVTSVSDPEEDKNQAKLFEDELKESEEDQDGQQDGAGETEGGEQEAGSHEETQDAADRPTSDSDLPDWMREGAAEGQDEVFFEGDTSEIQEDTPDAAQAEEQGEMSETDKKDPTVDKEELEQFILKEKPIFEDIPFDFPKFLEQRNGGMTWLQIAKSEGVPSTQISSKYRTYKERVAEMMKGGGAA
ncbi:hypothetical protein [Paenibacillus sp. SN-8-1]|uniref:hypothetical protein n=1 Tax=Paenibacillus sp. SN-8-1 TaxID=3435409 RepID=UPI003D9AAA69